MSAVPLMISSEVELWSPEGGWGFDGHLTAQDDGMSLTACRMVTGMSPGGEDFASRTRNCRACVTVQFRQSTPMRGVVCEIICL